MSPTKRQSLHSRPVRARAARSGMTLFEVMLALAIFMGAYTAVTKVLEHGSKAAIRAQSTEHALYTCDRKMNEIMGGVVPLATTTDAPLDDDPTGLWRWRATVGEAGVTGLLRVEITVTNTGTSNQAETRSLVRLVRDPAYLASVEAAAADAAAAAAEAAAALESAAGTTP